MRPRHFSLLIACAAILAACVEQLVAPSKTGSISLRLVSGQSASATCATAQPSVAGHLDAAQLVVVTGPTKRSTYLTLAADSSSFSGSLDGLDPGSYTVAVKGFVKGQVDYFGETSRVQVSSGQNAVAAVSFCSFRPILADLGLPTDSLAFTARWSRVLNADRYRIEWSKTPSVPNSWDTLATPDTFARITAPDTGTYIVRVLATNTSVPSGKPSDPDSIWVTVFPQTGHKTWTGRWGVNATNWSDPGNWLPPAVPTSAEIVEVRPAPNQPTLTADAAVAQLIVQVGATVNTNGDTLRVSGDVDDSGSITGTGIVVLTKAGKSLRGTVPNLLLSDSIVLAGYTTATGNVTVGPSATLNTDGDTLRVSGDLHAEGPITGPGLVVLIGSGKSLLGAVPNLQISGTISLSGRLTVTGDLAITGTGAKLSLNGESDSVSGDLNLIDGSLVMSNPADYVEIMRTLNISGTRNDTLLDGVMKISGDFHELCKAVSCVGSFYTGGKFEVQFDYQGPSRSQNIFFDDPAAWWFNNVRFTGAPDSVTFRTNARVAGNVVIPGDNVVYSEPDDTVFLCGRVDPFSIGSWSVSNTVLCQTPDSLIATVAFLFPTNAQINLSWTDNSTNEDGFLIERCQGVNCSTFAQIWTTGPNARSLGDAVDLATTYNYRLRGFNAVGVSAYSNAASASTPTLLQNGQTVDVSAPTGSQVYYAIQVPTGQTQLTVVTTAGTQNPGAGDADLYVRLGSQPTLTVWDCSSVSSFNSEQCTIPNPTAGDWHIMIYAHVGFSNTTLTATYQ
jgi:hypothetical protein